MTTGNNCACPRITVDVVLFGLRDECLQVLLVTGRQGSDKDEWAIPGGPLGERESLNEAAQRVLEKETGLTGLFLEQLYTFGEPPGDPRQRVITVAYFAVAPANAMPSAVSAQPDRVRWWPCDALPELALDHAEMVRYALTRLRYKLEYTAIGFELLPETFTLSELQAAYEIVLGEPLDKRNFRRKILSADVIEPTGRYRPGEGRPARLYRYRDDAVAEVKARRLFP